MTLLFLYGGYGVYVPPTTGYIDIHTRVPDYALTIIDRLGDMIVVETPISGPDMWGMQRFGSSTILGTSSVTVTGVFVTMANAPDNSFNVYPPGTELHVRAMDVNLTKNVGDL